MTKTNDIDKFLSEGAYHSVDGHCAPLKQFLEDFHAWLQTHGRDTAPWTRETVTAILSGRHPIGPGPRNVTVIGNLTNAPITGRYTKTEDGKVRLEQIKSRAA